MSVEVCSPIARQSRKANKGCFDFKAKLRLRKVWNEQHPENPISGNLSESALWDALDTRMKTTCKGSGREWCWVDKLGTAAKSAPEVARRILPEKPVQWYKDKHTWLSNYDIQKVMRQYEDDPSNHYKFLGVFSIDFATQDKFGRCVVDEVCSQDVFQFYKPNNSKQIKFVGFITNLDKHDEPGSHWTSMFVCIDPTMPCFGAYYYDSVSSKPPKEMDLYMKKLKLQAAQLTTVPFKLEYNNKRDQFGNSECGVFSIMYQLRWLEALKSNSATTFKDIIKVKLTDDQMTRYRDMLFRPNANAPNVLGGGKQKNKQT
jgi:hypothetical protein